MIRFQDIKLGDIIQADFDGKRFDGVVTEINHEDKQICVHNGDQDDWFEPGDLYAILDILVNKQGRARTYNDAASKTSSCDFPPRFHISLLQKRKIPN